MKNLFLFVSNVYPLIYGIFYTVAHILPQILISQQQFCLEEYSGFSKMNTTGVSDVIELAGWSELKKYWCFANSKMERKIMAPYLHQLSAQKGTFELKH